MQNNHQTEKDFETKIEEAKNVKQEKLQQAINTQKKFSVPEINIIAMFYHEKKHDTIMAIKLIKNYVIDAEMMQCMESVLVKLKQMPDEEYNHMEFWITEDMEPQPAL